MDYALIDIEENPSVKGALSRLGMSHAGPATIIVHGAAITNASPQEVWDVWSQMEKWPQWMGFLVSSSRWLEKRSFEVGARFEMVRHFGFPIGRQVTVSTVREVTPGSGCAWWDGEGGMRSCQIWLFEPTADGRTRIQCTEVFVGFMVFFAKPIVRRRWNKRFRKAVEGLAEAVKKTTGRS